MCCQVECKAAFQQRLPSADLNYGSEDESLTYAAGTLQLRLLNKRFRIRTCFILVVRFINGERRDPGVEESTAACQGKRQQPERLKASLSVFRSVSVALRSASNLRVCSATLSLSAGLSLHVPACLTCSSA